MEKEENRDDKSNFNMIRFIFDATTKLETSPLTTATAACIYHRFYQVMPDCEIDKKLVAAVAIYLAGKVEENHLKVRDVINVCYRMVFTNTKPLELGDEYFNLRDTFVNLELILLRALRFQVNFQHPHKYLLQYFWSLSNWAGNDVWKSQPVLQTALAFIQDFLHDPQYLTFKAQHMAVAAIYLAFQCYGVEIPCASEAEVTWYEALVDDIDDNLLWTVVTAIINNYDQETTTKSQTKQLTMMRRKRVRLLLLLYCCNLKHRNKRQIGGLIENGLEEWSFSHVKQDAVVTVQHSDCYLGTTLPSNITDDNYHNTLFTVSRLHVKCE